MKKLFSLLAAGLLVSLLPVYAKSPDLGNPPEPTEKMKTDVAEAAEAAKAAAHSASGSENTPETTNEPSPAQKQILQKERLLRGEQRVVTLDKNGVRIQGVEKEGFIPAQEITWAAVEEEIDTIRSQYDNEEQDEKEQAGKNFSKIMSAEELVRSLQTPKAGLPDYGELTRGKKYIYIAEASEHNTLTLPRESARILQEIRQANPDARILLALEMAMLIEQFQTPFLPAQREKDPAYIYIYPEYKVLTDTAQKQQIDVLALDDYSVFKTQFPNTFVAKIGSYGVRFDVTSARLRTLVSAYGEDFKNEAHNVVYDLLSRSSWGMQQRNDQWVRYIYSIEKFYDIIIVYAGSAHLLLNVYHSVPNMIGENGILLDLLTVEQLSAEMQQFSENAQKVQEAYKLSPEFSDSTLTTYEKAVWEAKERQLKPFLKKLKQNKPFWIDYTSNDEMKKNVLLKLPQRERVKYLNQPTGILPGDFRWVAVYLPQEKKKAN